VRDKLAACLVLVFICSLSSASVLAAEEIILRTAVTPGEAWVGQKVVLHVDVLAKDGWAQLKKVTDAEVEGAYLLRLESQGTRLSETIDGDSYTGQRYDFMLFAQRDGKITVPPVPVDVEIKTWGAGGGSRIERMSLPLVEFVTRTPPGAQGIRGLISTSNLTARQDWDPETESPVVGDAIKRRITLRAEDVSGMAFAPTLHNEIDNLGIYPGEPTVEDKFARGDLTGTRVETVTYVVERAGDFELPSIELSWWNIDTQELQHIVLPGFTLQVTGGPAVASQLNERRSWSVLIVLLVVVVVLLVFAGRLLTGWTAWHQARNETEAAFFRRIRRSARTGDKDAVLRDTMRWLDRINDDSQAARLDLFMQKYGESRASDAVLDQSESSTMAYFSSLAVARKRWQQAQHGGGASYFLPDLNG
jgi:hypothetical protein